MNQAERDALAAEYVAGLLDEETRADVERRLRRDAKFAAMTADWRARLSELDETAPPVTPSPELWPNVQAALSRRKAPAQRRRAPPLWRNVGFWRPLSAGLAAAAVALFVFAGVQTMRAERQPVMVAVLLNDSGQVVALVNTFDDGRAELAPLTQIAVPQGRAIEVWTAWDDAIGPRSIGVLDSAHSAPLDLRRLPLGEDQFFAISIEPEGGSPTGAPTGPIVGAGRTNSIL